MSVPDSEETAKAIQHVSFELHRDTDDITIAGPGGSADCVFAYIDKMSLDPPCCFRKIRRIGPSKDISVSVVDADSILEDINHDRRFRTLFPFSDCLDGHLNSSNLQDSTV